MPDITFSVKLEHLPRLIEAHAAYFGYREVDENGQPNQETRAAYVKRKMWRQMVDRTREYEIGKLVMNQRPPEIEEEV